MVDPALSASVNQLFINSSCSSGPHQGDPACPNAVLGDLRVRQAIQLSIDKQALVRGVLGDADQVAESLLPVGPYAPALVPAGLNPDKARQLLDQAGWSVGTDGIRTRDGVRAQLSLLITAGGSVSPAIAQVIQEKLQDVGIDTQIKEVPGAVLQGGFVGNSPLNLGAFDLVFASNTTPTDPQAYLHAHFASDQIPNPALQSGNNFSRIQDRIWTSRSRPLMARLTTGISGRFRANPGRRRDHSVVRVATGRCARELCRRLGTYQRERLCHLEYPELVAEQVASRAAQHNANAPGTKARSAEWRGHDRP